MNPVKIITEEEFKKQKKYEADVQEDNNELEDFDIPIPKNNINSSKNVNNHDEEEEKKLEIICNIFDLRGVDYVPDSLELNELLSKSLDDLKEIEKSLKGNKVIIKK